MTVNFLIIDLAVESGENLPLGRRELQLKFSVLVFIIADVKLVALVSMPREIERIELKKQFDSSISFFVQFGLATCCYLSDCLSVSERYVCEPKKY